MEKTRKGIVAKKGFPEGAEEAMREHNVPPVSYTHLDVYKRQP